MPAGRYYLHERGTDLHGAKGETERHRGSYWGQNAIADHRTSWKSSPMMPQSSFWEGTNERTVKPTIAALRVWLKTCPLIADEQGSHRRGFSALPDWKKESTRLFHRGQPR